jgi:16S rRNA (cytosine967-C5)-methyltransferase
MRVTTLIEHSAELIRIVYNSPQPTDKILSEYFRSKKQYGSKERRFVVNTIYFVLRNYLLLNHLISKNPISNHTELNVNTRNVITALFLALDFPKFSTSYKPDELIKKVESSESTDSILKSLLVDVYEDFCINVRNEINNLETRIALMLHLDDIKDFEEEISLRYSLPELLLNKILPVFQSKDELFSFLNSSIEQAPLILRINILKSDKNQIISYFSENEIEVFDSKVIDTCIYTYNRLQLTEIELYKEGKIEVQDEGSQLISAILNPLDNEIILDACAGAGGKSIHIACLQMNQGLVIANDIEFHRLKEIAKRSERAGITTVIPYLSKKGINNFNNILKLSKGHLFDKVLIDAPCSGSGTIRRDPLKKYRITQRIINKINLNQSKILEEYSKFVRPGGILLYSTCSILPEENEQIIKQFLMNNPNFEPIEIELDNKYLIENSKIRRNGAFLNIDFRNTVSDGFFMAKLVRID